MVIHDVGDTRTGALGRTRVSDKSDLLVALHHELLEQKFFKTWVGLHERIEIRKSFHSLCPGVDESKPTKSMEEK